MSDIEIAPPEQISTRAFRVTFLIALLASLAEIFVWYLSAANALPLLLAFGGHCALSLLLALTGMIGGGDRTGRILLAAGTFFMGPFGAAGGVAMALFASLPHHTDFAAYRRSLGPGDQSFEVPFHVRHQPGTTLLSFNDVMNWGARREKQAALRRIAERYSPAFASALKLALRDPAQEIRSEAGAAANAILNTLETRAKALAKDAAKGDAQDSLLHGDAELAIARSGLAPKDRAAAARHAALAAYAEAMARDPRLFAAHLKASEALLESADYLEAARESAACLDAPGGSGKALSVHLESLFALGQYGQIRHVLATRTPQEKSLTRASAMWRNAQPARPKPAVQTKSAPKRRLRIRG